MVQARRPGSRVHQHRPHTCSAPLHAYEHRQHCHVHVALFASQPRNAPARPPRPCFAALSLFICSSAAAYAACAVGGMPLYAPSPPPPRCAPGMPRRPAYILPGGPGSILLRFILPLLRIFMNCHTPTNITTPTHTHIHTYTQVRHSGRIHRSPRSHAYVASRVTHAQGTLGLRVCACVCMCVRATCLGYSEAAHRLLFPVVVLAACASVCVCVCVCVYPPMSSGCAKKLFCGCVPALFSSSDTYSSLSITATRPESPTPNNNNPDPAIVADNKGDRLCVWSSCWSWCCWAIVSSVGAGG